MLRKLLQHFDPAIRELKDLVKVCEEKAVDEDIKRRVEKALQLATVGTCNLWCLYSRWCVTTVCMDYRSYGYNTLYDALDKSMLNDNEDVSGFNVLLTQLHAVNCHIVWVFLKMEARSRFKKNTYLSVLHSHTVLMKLCPYGRYRQLNSVLYPYNHILKSSKNNL